MGERTAEDFAIEFGEYLAKAAEAFIADCDEHPLDPRESADTYRALKSAIYEFRKRAARVHSALQSGKPTPDTGENE